MLLPVQDDTTKTFIERLPEIISAAAANPLGLVALIVICFGLLAFFMFKNTNAKMKLGALAVVVGGVMTLAFVAIINPGKGSTDEKKEEPVKNNGKTPDGAPLNPNCMVKGSVFNS